MLLETQKPQFEPTLYTGSVHDCDQPKGHGLNGNQPQSRTVQGETCIDSLYKRSTYHANSSSIACPPPHTSPIPILMWSLINPTESSETLRRCQSSELAINLAMPHLPRRHLALPLHIQITTGHRDPHRDRDMNQDELRLRALSVLLQDLSTIHLTQELAR